VELECGARVWSSSVELECAARVWSSSVERSRAPSAMSFLETKTLVKKRPPLFNAMEGNEPLKYPATHSNLRHSFGSDRRKKVEQLRMRIESMFPRSRNNSSVTRHVCAWIALFKSMHLRTRLLNGTNEWMTSGRPMQPGIFLLPVIDGLRFPKACIAQ
jgi:hypothetical protein